jgi:hypothetical protein
VHEKQYAPFIFALCLRAEQPITTMVFNELVSFSFLTKSYERVGPELIWALILRAII